MENNEMSLPGLPLDQNAFAKPKVKGLKLLKGITKMLANTAIKNYSRVPSDVIDTVFDAFSANPSYVAWRLISRSLVGALLQLLNKSDHHYKEEEVETEPLDKRLNEQLEKQDYTLGMDFFNNPKSLSLLRDIKPVLKDYLGCFGFTENQITNILERFDSYFVLSLREEWGNNEDTYSALKGIITTPFDTAVKKEVEWNNYFIDLEREILKPVFSESFSLEQIYIPLRACYKEVKNKKEKDELDNRIDKTNNKEEKEIVIDIESYLSDWIQKEDKDDHTRIIHGGPGSGKSSFLKLFAAKLAQKGQKVVFIPLHLYYIGGKLDRAVNDFLTNARDFSSDIITNDEKDKIILLFDGLDELSMQGKMLTEVAQSFLREVEKSVSNFNHRYCRFQVIISGRDVVVQQNEREFRNEGQVLRLLPYLIQEDKERFIDKQKLLEKDQRDDWWKKYGDIIEKNYSELPQELKTDEIDEITAQPLLNYLVALSYQRGQINFSQNTNLNEIYADLLNNVYERKYAEGEKHNTVGQMQFEEFCLIFEEIALSAWHGKGRTTTVAEIKSHFQNSGLTDLLKCFIDDAEQGVISLLAAFYFRQAGNNMDGSQTFEFTHKSFGEYLTAKKIVHQLETIHAQLTKKENAPYKPDGWNIVECLVEWIKVFGVKTLDFDLIKFIRNELQLVNKKDESVNLSWQKTVVKLLEYVLNNGMPMEELRLKTFKEENEQAINSEKALLVIHSTIAEITNIGSTVNWPERTSFGEFIGRLSEQRTDPNVFILNFCNHLDLNSSVLWNKDLCNSNFSYSDLSLCYLLMAHLEGAHLEGAHLEGAHLEGAYLEEAHLEGAYLREAHLEGAYLRGAYLRGAHLVGAHLKRASLERAHLESANLEGAHLESANLKRAYLTGANLERAYLTGANLERADMRGANLEGAFRNDKSQ